MNKDKPRLMRIDVTGFRVTLQLVSLKGGHNGEIDGFGSGFIIRHRDRLFLATADHNVHWDDYQEINDTGQQ